MAKDPILPLYYNDIDRSTRDWTDEEFGAYMRLLMHQWDKGSLPKDYQRLTRLATSLSTTWPTIKDKFIEKNGGLINLKMEEVREKREKHKEKQRENIAKRYQTSTKPITKNLPLENEFENEKEKEIKEGGMGEEKFLIPEMLTVWKRFKPDYPSDKLKDFKALQTIAKFICSQIALAYAPEIEGNRTEILNHWQTISKFVADHNFFRNYSLHQVEKHIQSIIQEIKNGPKTNTGRKNGRPTDAEAYHKFVYGGTEGN
jgi:uncharacterized protein YdaU (DUF1376 family)